jgi:hypothetical protein
MLKHFIICALLLCLSFSLKAQNDSLTINSVTDKKNIYKVKTKDGAAYTGYIIQNDSVSVKVENKNTGHVYTIPSKEVDSIVKEEKKKEPKLTELYGENDHADFYMLAQSSFSMKKNEIKTQYHWLTGEHADFAISENWAITANTLLFAPVSFGAKCHYPLFADWHVGANAFITGNILSATSANSPLFLGGFAMGKLTKGNSNRNISVNAGLLRLYVSSGINLFNTSNKTNGNIYFAALAFCNRIGPRAAIVGESWYLPQGALSFSGLGIKLIGSRESSWTFGCYALYFGNDLNATQLKGRVLPIPYIGYGSKF